MGQFSWMDCKNDKRAILDNISVDVYVLVPKEFREQYGVRIHEGCYDGYGHFGSYDMYDLVALWNRDHIGEEDIRPVLRSQYEDGPAGDEYYQRGLRHYEYKVQRLRDFIHNVPEEEMYEKYGNDYLREIGIDIACYDEQNEALEYPIKITHDKSETYEACEPSKGDENQGWGMYLKQYDKDLNYCTYEEIKEAYENADYLTEETLREYLEDNFEKEYKRDFGFEIEERDY